jgi:hypothetical protein
MNSSPQITPPNSRSSSFDMRLPAPRVNAFPNPGSFFVGPDSSILKNMYDLIDKHNLWNWLANYIPENEKGYMLSNSPEMKLIVNEMSNLGHDNKKFDSSMSQMNYIAKNGWIDYYRNYVAPYFVEQLTKAK